MKQVNVTIVIRREGNGYVALCPELDIASQGDTVAEARHNLIEAVEGFLDVASPAEVAQRLGDERYVEDIEVRVA